MSIIHDALKKTQDKIKGSNNSGPQKPMFNPLGNPGSGNTSSPQPSSKTNSSYGPKTIILLVVLTLFLVGGIIFYFVHDPNTAPNVTKSPSAAPIVVSKNESVSQGIEEMVKGIHFQGTASNGSSTAALINDDIYEVGGTINGLEIQAIRKNEIDLTAGGESITLRIQ